MPTSLTFWLISFLPIALLVFLLIGINMGALKSAPLTLVITILTGVFIFQADLQLIVVELLKAGWDSLSIVLVIISAIFLYEVSSEGKALETIKVMFQKITPNELLRILLIGVAFASFLQGVTGFGVPVLVTAPLLMQIGVKASWAVIIPLIGHSWAGTFGTLAIAWDALIQQLTGVSSSFILSSAIFATVFLFILTLVANFFITLNYGGTAALKKVGLVVLILSIIQGGGQILFVTFSPALATFIPSALSILFLISVSQLKWFKEEWQVEESNIMYRQRRSNQTNSGHMSVLEALLPYILMTVVTLVVLLIPAVNNALGGFEISPSFPATSTGYGVMNTAVENYSPLQPFTHASAFLFLASIVTYIYYRRAHHVEKGSLSSVLKRSFGRAFVPSITVLTLLAISGVMAGTGQTLILADGIANVLGPYYALIAPFIGLLGSFITGSNMSSNILFGEFQLLTSELVQLNGPTIIGSQTAGGAIGMSIAPGNVILGTSSVNITGREGKIIIKNLPFTVLVSAVMSGLLFYLNFLM